MRVTDWVLHYYCKGVVYVFYVESLIGWSIFVPPMLAVDYILEKVGK